METKVTRFVDLFLLFLVVTALLHIFDEVSPATVRLYVVTSNHKQIGFTEELKINKNLDYTILVEDSMASNQNDAALLVEVDQATYFRARKGDKAFVYSTPIHQRIRFCLDERHPVLRHQNPFQYRYPLDISNLVMPVLILALALFAYKSTTFEIKFATFLFTSIFAIVLKWFLR